MKLQDVNSEASRADGCVQESAVDLHFKQITIDSTDSGDSEDEQKFSDDNSSCTEEEGLVICIRCGFLLTSTSFIAHEKECIVSNVDVSSHPQACTACRNTCGKKHFSRHESPCKVTDKTRLDTCQTCDVGSKVYASHNLQ